ncbi:hypothetical protein BZA05DRAFT_471626 [Tricharina praecox]|uniref:uncharacterized protein n=1 Tax=Tricharina praecox TaxID=43433 RepID=UPI00221E9B4F|nr:uncharacterized protein BZA05DRAFT_471626 [Tricharina praecox]KAI5856603.1 hypothetical protein BZA05DRAFT_471626 [Tricharina praecox]
MSSTICLNKKPAELGTPKPARTLKPKSTSNEWDKTFITILIALIALMVLLLVSGGTVFQCSDTVYTGHGHQLYKPTIVDHNGQAALKIPDPACNVQCTKLRSPDSWLIWVLAVFMMLVMVVRVLTG